MLESKAKRIFALDVQSLPMSLSEKVLLMQRATGMLHMYKRHKKVILLQREVHKRLLPYSGFALFVDCSQGRLEEMFNNFKYDL